MNHRSSIPQGKVLVPVLCVVIGILIGVALGIVPRFFNLDPMRWIKTEAVQTPETTEKNDADEKKVKGDAIHPKEVELRRLIADVQKQRALLDDREKPLAAREAKIEQEKKELAELKQQMDAVETRTKKASLDLEASEQKNIKRLAKMWAQMEPAEVVALVKNLDIDLAAKVISSMQERAAAPIFGAMATAADSEKLAPELVQKFKQIKQATEAASTNKKEKS